MATFNKLPPILTAIALLYYPGYLLADTYLSEGITEFNATILEGSCDWTWNETRLSFLPVTEDRIKTGDTLEIKPLTASIQCTEAITPQLKITGNTPFSDNDKVFLDGPNTRNVGFMLQLADEHQPVPSLSSFYSQGMAGKAIANNVAVAIPPVAQVTQQIIWVGLVGLKVADLTKTGSFTTTLIFTGLIP